MISRWRVALLLVLVAGLCGKPLFASEPTPVQAIKAPLANRSLLLDIARFGEGIVAVGERGHVLVSRDNGDSWAQAEDVPTRESLTAVTFHDDNLGWAVGHNALILRTTDGGNHWEVVYSAPELEQPLLNVWFDDAVNGYAVGAYGYLLVTRDGGYNWEERVLDLGEELGEDDFPPDWHLNHLVRLENGTFLIAAEAGNLYASVDGAKTWQTLDIPYEGSFYKILSLQGESLLVLGLRGNLFRTDDAGQSWVKIETGTTASLLDGIQLSDGRIVLGGLGGVVLVSNDGGHSFTAHQEPDRADISALLDNGQGGVIALGKGGIRMLRSIADDGNATLVGEKH